MKCTSNIWSVSHIFSPALQVQEYLTRFESIPDMLELDHLTVSGDVTFGKNVSLKVNDRIHIPFYWKSFRKVAK